MESKFLSPQKRGDCTQDKKYRAAHKEKALQYQREWRAKNKERANEYGRRWYAKNKEKKKAAVVAWRKKSPENTERYRAAMRKSYWKNREKYLPKMRAWYAANRERAKAIIAAWNKAHPLALRKYDHQRRALKRGAVGSCTVEQLEARIAFYGHCCAYCGGPYETLDHVIPLVRGGSNWPSNLRPACRKCNSTKKDRLLGKEWTPPCPQSAPNRSPTSSKHSSTQSQCTTPSS